MNEEALNQIKKMHEAFDLLEKSQKQVIAILEKVLRDPTIRSAVSMTRALDLNK